MLVPVPPTVREGLHLLTRKLIEICVSSTAALIAMTVFAYVTKSTPPTARAPVAVIQAAPVEQETPGETDESMADFLERVALSHVASLKSPPVADRVVSSAPSSATEAPLPPHPSAAKPNRQGSPKLRVAAAAAKVPAEEPSAAPAVAPETVSAPARSEPLPPVQFGMRLVANLGTIICDSRTRVVEGVASVSDKLTSLVKKL